MISAVLVGGSGRYGAAANAEPWFPPALEAFRRVLRRGVPFLASCWGIQALAVALGGTVAADPERAELGTLPVRLTPEGRRDPVFRGLPVSFAVQAGHSESVVALPPGAILLASSERNEVQAFRMAGRPVYAFQFHPEMGPEDLALRVRHYFRELGLDPADLAEMDEGLGPSPEALEIVRRFAKTLGR